MPYVYIVALTRAARKDLDGFDAQMTRRIGVVVDALAAEPRPPGCVKTKSEDGVWCLRMGEYRSGYRIDDVTRTVTIIRIGSRGDFYDN